MRNIEEIAEHTILYSLGTGAVRVFEDPDKKYEPSQIIPHPGFGREVSTEAKGPVTFIRSVRNVAPLKRTELKMFLQEDKNAQNSFFKSRILGFDPKGIKVICPRLHCIMLWDWARIPSKNVLILESGF